MSYSCCINVSWKGLIMCPKGHCFKQSVSKITGILILISTLHCWRMKVISEVVHGRTVFPTLWASRDRQKNGTYIRLLGMIFCPSLYHVTSGRGKEAWVGRLMTAARPCVTVFLCSSEEKFPWTWRRKSNDTIKESIYIYRKNTPSSGFFMQHFHKQPWLSKAVSANK